MNDLVHVILDEPQTGSWNMAVDEALLEESLGSGSVFLRFYRWSEPTVSLGHFQKESELSSDRRLAHLACVQRLSGGGAILHHHEQTYSCSLPPSHRLAQQPQQLYREIHAHFVAWLSEWGIAVTQRGRNAPLSHEPLLCFNRKAAPDLVIQGNKVLGSAQRRRRGAVLQHGSLLLGASEYAPELLGLRELTPKFPDTQVIWIPFAKRLARCLGESIVIQELPATVRNRATTFEKEYLATCRLIAQP